jgi:O-antigen/teichoic acid export membrane protein
MVALSLMFGLQELHIIVVKHQASADAAGSYAVAAVAAKAIIWVAIGLGLYLLPEAARRANAGLDARPILTRSLALIGLCTVPALLIFTLAGKQLLSAAFGEHLTRSADALPWLGAAMALLACTYLSVQYLLALRRSWFMAVLAVAVTSEVVVLASLGANLERLAMGLFAVQLACALVVVTTAYRTRS